MFVRRLCRFTLNYPVSSCFDTETAPADLEHTLPKNALNFCEVNTISASVWNPPLPAASRPRGFGGGANIQDDKVLAHWIVHPNAERHLCLSLPNMVYASINAPM
jgi:hypothetical protein